MLRARNRLLGIAICTLLLGGAALTLDASDRRQSEGRSAGENEIKQAYVVQDVERPLNRQPLAIGYMTSEGEVTGLWLTVGNEQTGQVKYTFENVRADKDFAPVQDAISAVEPENFIRMRGTQGGMAAIAHALGQMLENHPPAINKMKVQTDPNMGKIEGVAFFEGTNGSRILTVRFERGEPVFEELGSVATGCIATVPHHTCGCTASGSNCNSGTQPNGTNFAKCKDSAGSTTCTGVGGTCSCQDGGVD